MSNILMTPIDTFEPVFSFVQRIGAGSGEAGSFNGTTTTAGTKQSTNDSIFDRHHVIRLWDNFTDAAVFQHTLNPRYKNQSQIMVDVYWTTDSSTSGDVYLSVGLSQSGSDGVLGDDTDTEYIAFAGYAGPTSTKQIIKTTFTFNATLHGGVIGNDSVSFIIMRKGADSLDTINNQFKITGLVWRYTINKFGI
jgi:hypothetical protein